MSLPRFYCQTLAEGDVTLSPEESRHACRVLRLDVGDPVLLFDGDGGLAEGRVQGTTSKTCVVMAGPVARMPRPGGPSLTLVTALPRAHRQQFLFEKCTELGVARIVPTAFDRSTVKPKPSTVAKWKVWTIEAGKQSGCRHLPKIDPPSGFRETVSQFAGVGACIVGVIDSQALPPGKLVSQLGGVSSVVAWIGPEGGLTDEELAQLRSAGARPISLSPNVLRIETAAIALAVAATLSCPAQAIKEEQGLAGA